jgi:hypothetical protein
LLQTITENLRFFRPILNKHPYPVDLQIERLFPAADLGKKGQRLLELLSFSRSTLTLKNHHMAALLLQCQSVGAVARPEQVWLLGGPAPVLRVPVEGSLVIGLRGGLAWIHRNQQLAYIALFRNEDLSTMLP